MLKTYYLWTTNHTPETWRQVLVGILELSPCDELYGAKLHEIQKAISDNLQRFGWDTSIFMTCYLGIFVTPRTLKVLNLTGLLTNLVVKEVPNLQSHMTISQAFTRAKTLDAVEECNWILVNSQNEIIYESRNENWDLRKYRRSQFPGSYFLQLWRLDDIPVPLWYSEDRVKPIPGLPGYWMRLEA